MVFIWYLGKMYKPMQDFAKITDAYAKASVGYERLREVLETQPNCGTCRTRRLRRRSKVKSNSTR